nr:Fic family protein [uncultured Holophaga sp.]
MFAGLSSGNLLASAISRQSVSFGGISKWSDPMLATSSLFFGLVKNHAFLDGNKRIALLMLLKSLLRQKRIVTKNQTVFENFTVATAASTLKESYPDLYSKYRNKDDMEIYIIRDFIKRHTRTLNSGYYSITFRELKTILGKHGFEMGDQDGNSINIYKYEMKSTWFGLGKPRTVRSRVCKIGFPSWTKQVSKRDLDILREATGLTPENGYDNTVLFEGSEPLYKLIHDFEGPLKRLKDR